ncbi:hypothetical protein ACLB2K_066993 [Fragaria x ananassa]
MPNALPCATTGGGEWVTRSTPKPPNLSKLKTANLKLEARLVSSCSKGQELSKMGSLKPRCHRNGRSFTAGGSSNLRVLLRRAQCS